MKSFKNKVVVITGAGKGIGENVALSYAREGAKLAIIDRNAEDLKETENQIRQQGVEVFSRVMDLTQPMEIVNAIDDIKSELGMIEIFINNAVLVKSK